MHASDSIYKKLSSGFILLVLLSYSILTITPFYFLFIRSFVPTMESTKFHGWVPPDREFNMEARFGQMATFYNLDLNKFKKTMGIEGYVDTNITIGQLASEYSIPQEKLRNFFKPYYLYNGWINLLGSRQFYTAFIATVIVTACSVLFGTILGSMTGFGLAGFKRKWQSIVYTLYLLQMVVPGVIIMLPSYIIVRTLYLTNTYTVLVLMSISGGALSAMMFTSAASDIPKELRESVRVDGGSPFLYYRAILLPLIKPVIGAYSIIMLPLVWNSLLGSLLYNKPDHYLLMAFINSFSGSFSTNYQAIYAGLAMALLPILALYLGLQNLFVKAALAGAVKG